MSRGKAVIIGNETYPNRAAAVKAVSAILQGASAEKRLDGATGAVITALFQSHPSAPEKAPAGVVAHLVRRIEYRPGIWQRCFFAVRPDGSEVDWSYRVALGVAPAGPTLEEAAREAVSEQVAAYKAMRFGSRDCMPCDLTGKDVAFPNAHVDHAPPWPFVEILRAFVLEGGAPRLLPVEPWGTAFADPADRARFLAFHDACATLRILDGKVNIGRGARA